MRLGKQYIRPVLITIGLMMMATVAIWYTLGDSAAEGQEPATHVTPLDWPPFVATYETNIRALSINGVRQTGREVRQIEWNATDDWKVTVLSSPTIGDRDGTGTYWEQRGNVYSRYDTWDDEPVVETEELPDRHYYMPPEGVFFPHLYSNDNFDTRTDGDIVVLNVRYCDGSRCGINADMSGNSARSSSDPSGPTLLQGRRFDETPATLSDDANRIPLVSGHVRVTKLHTNPPPTPTPTPTPTATPTPTPTATPAPTPTATPVPLDGNPRAESVTSTTVTVSWDRLGSLPSPESATDYRVNYRRSASESWTFGNYVTSESFGNRRPQTTVPRSGALRCNTEYEFQVQAQILGQGDAWRDYGTLTTRTGAC